MAIGSFFVGLATSSATDLLGGASRAIGYLANRLLPNAALPIDTYVQMYRTRWINAPELYKGMLDLGFKFDVANAESYEIVKQKFTNQPAVVFRPPDLNKLSQPTRFICGQKSLVDPATALDMLNRGLMDESLVKYILNLNNGGETKLTIAQMELRKALPSVNDLTLFSANQIIDQAIVDRYGLDSDRPPFFNNGAAKLGYDYEVLEAPTGGFIDENKRSISTYAKLSDLYWRSHWVFPSVERYAEVMFRNYPASLHGPDPNVNKQDYFSQDEYEFLQKLEGVPPGLRSKLQSVAFRPLMKRDLKALYAKNLLSYKEGDWSLFHAVKAMGYSDENAERISKQIVLTARTDIVDLSVSTLDKMFENGIIDREELISGLQKLFYPENEARIHANNLALNLRLNDVEVVKNLVKGSFLGGDIGNDQVVGIFNRFGVGSSQVQGYLNLWTLEKTLKHKYVSAQQAITFFKNGIVNEGQLRSKLGWLDYRADEIELMVTNAKFELLSRQLATQEKSARQLQKMQSALDKAQEKAQKEAQKVVGQLVKAKQKTVKDSVKTTLLPFSETNLKAYGNKNYLTYGQLVKILLDKGWTQLDADRWVLTFTPKVKGIPNGLKETISATSSPSKP